MVVADEPSVAQCAAAAGIPEAQLMSDVQKCLLIQEHVDQLCPMCEKLVLDAVNTGI